MKEKGNKILILLITIFAFAIILFAGAYAYFNSLGSLGNVIVSANVAENNSLFTSSGTDISLEVTANNMQQNANYLGVVASNTGTLNVSYLAGTTDPITCTYDVYYKWNSGEYSITDEEQNEFTYSISLGGSPIKAETNFVASSNTSAQKVNSESLSITNSSESTATVQSYDISTKFYNIDKDQRANSDKSWSIKFYVDNIICGDGMLYDSSEITYSNAATGCTNVTCMLNYLYDAFE